jgi:hypothetical protein
MTKNFIQGIGIELEGVWDELPLEFFNNHVYRHDGSINGFEENSCNICQFNKRNHIEKNKSCWDISESESKSYNFVGELASKVFNSKTGMLPNACKWAIKYTPIEFNASCSQHIHISVLNDICYLLLNSKKFFKHFYNCLDYWLEVRAISKDSHFYKRVKGVNVGSKHSTNYCKKEFKPYDNINKSEAQDRYNGLNFCKQKHNTLEIRIGTPFKDPLVMSDYIKFCFDTINGYLIRNYKPTNIKRSFDL